MLCTRKGYNYSEIISFFLPLFTEDFNVETETGTRDGSFSLGSNLGLHVYLVQALEHWPPRTTVGMVLHLTSSTTSNYRYQKLLSLSCPAHPTASVSKFFTLKMILYVINFCQFIHLKYLILVAITCQQL